MQNNDIWTSIQVSMGTRHNLSFCACKTAWLAPELLVSMSPSPHLWFLQAKQRILDQNYKSLWVQDLTNRFVHAWQRDLHQNDKSIWVPDLICGFCIQKATFGPAYKSLWVPDITCRFVHAKQRDLHQNDKSKWVPELICGFEHV